MAIGKKQLARLAVGTLLVGSLSHVGCSSDPASLYDRKCSPCHDDLDHLVEIYAPSYQTLDDWHAMIEDMQKETNTISDSDADGIAQYLYGKYNA